MKLVLIEWVDSLRDDNSWVWNNDQEYDDLINKMNHESVGWIIKETKDFICLSHSRTVFIYDDKDTTFIRSVSIPKCSIKKITRLK